MPKRPLPKLRPAMLSLALAGALGAQAALDPSGPGGDRYPGYTPVSAEGFSATQLLTKEARWLRNQVWSTGPVADAASFLLPRSYDVTSGYGFLGTDYFTWMLENNRSYFQYEASHNDHRDDAPLDSSNDATLERVLMAWGTNAYDAASWAVALSAASRCQPFSREEKADFTGAVNAYLKFLVTASYPGGLQSYRAFDVNGALRWSYGESGLDAAYGTDAQGNPLDDRNAYYWQYAPTRWQNPDPHWDPLAVPGAVMNWPGWSVITGEEAWAAFLAPMQVAYNQHPGPGWAANPEPLNAPALVENACRSLHAVELMRNSVTGGLYRNVRPPNSPEAERWFDTSLENNWSMYAGLGFLERALVDLQGRPGGARLLKVDLEPCLASLRGIRKGMAAFFSNKALVWHGKGEPFGDPAAVNQAFFLQGTTGRAGAAVGVTGAFATDVQTWGIAAILADRELERTLEAVYGPHFLYDMFKAAIVLGGYYVIEGGRAPTLAGIGFNAQQPGDPAGQLSGEWTWGAVNAAMVLADFYREPGRADPARAAELLGYARSMIAGVDRYASHYYNPQHLRDGLDWVGYLYSNRRQWIPWGWFANACPSTAATSWALRVNCGFNAFELGGGEHQATARALGLSGR